MRRSSIILAVTAVIVPFAWAYLFTTALYERGRMQGVYICGLPALAAVILACLASSIMSAAAVILGTMAYRHLPAPRTLRRRLEVASLSLPLVIFGTYAAILLFA